MPAYQYLCPKCNELSEEFVTMSERKSAIVCPNCGEMSPQTLVGSTVTHKDSPRKSRAMAVHPSQIEAATKKWPGSRYDKDGLLDVANRTEKKERMRQRGYVEL